MKAQAPRRPDLSSCIILPAEIQELLHAGGDIPAPSPDQARPGMDLRGEGDAGDLREEGQHALIEKAAAAFLAQEGQDGGDLAGAHDDPGLDIQGREAGLEDAVEL